MSVGSVYSDTVEYTEVDTGASLTNLDPFISALRGAVGRSTLTSWIVRPAVAEALSKLKVQSGSNRSLLRSLGLL